MNNTERNQRDLLPLIQADFPITRRPFKELAGRIGWQEDEVIAALRKLMEEKLVRCLGPVFEPRRLGYVSTLVAAEADQERVAELAVMMLEIPEITHNYLRDHEINLWFTVTACSPERLDDIVGRIDKFPGLIRLFNLPREKVYKINAVFDATQEKRLKDGDEDIEPVTFTDIDKTIVRTIQEEFPVIREPFRALAEMANIPEDQLIATIEDWIERGIIRRFGARVDHRRHGYSANALTLWQGDYIDSWGERFAELSYVSHCYRRRALSDWPYELYTMVHAKSQDEMQLHLNEMRTFAPEARMLALRSLYELKKTTMKYFIEG